jgi:hypothetical protein
LVRVLAPPHDGYTVIRGGWTTPVPTIREAARELARAYLDSSECRIVACPSPHRRRELHPWERTAVVDAATSLLAA